MLIKGESSNKRSILEKCENQLHLWKWKLGGGERGQNKMRNKLREYNIEKMMEKRQKGWRRRRKLREGGCFGEPLRFGTVARI